MGQNKYNIFQGNMALKETVAEALGLELGEYRLETEKIYFTAFFYLSQRFGQATKEDTYKDAGVWSFTVKNYTIQIYISSTDVNFIVFGDYRISSLLLCSCYWVKLHRARANKEHLLIRTFIDNTERSAYEREQLDKIGAKISEEKNLTNLEYDELEKDLQDELQSIYLKRVEAFNKKIIDVKYEDYEKYGDYSNAKTRHALRTLHQFLNNMLTPIYVRDCPFNIKGRMSDIEAASLTKWDNNIKIEFQKQGENNDK